MSHQPGVTAPRQSQLLNKYKARGPECSGFFVFVIPHFRVTSESLFGIASAAADSSTHDLFREHPVRDRSYHPFEPVSKMADPRGSCAFYRDKIFHNEGQKYLDYLAGQERTLPGNALDVIFLAFSFDLQPSTTTRPEEKLPRVPNVPEMSVACLDTRRLSHPAAVPSSVSEGPIIETWRYKGAEQGLTDHEIATAITKYLRRRDTNSPDPAALRSVILVGSPVWSDFNVLERTGVDFGSLGHVLTTLDISALRGQLFPSAKEDLTPAAFAQWLLSDLSLGSDTGGSAATPAAYALHTLLRLAIKRAEADTLAQYPRPAKKSKVLVCLREAAAARPRLAEAERPAAGSLRGQE